MEQKIIESVLWGLLITAGVVGIVVAIIRRKKKKPQKLPHPINWMSIGDAEELIKKVEVYLDDNLVENESKIRGNIEESKKQLDKKKKVFGLLGLFQFVDERLEGIEKKEKEEKK